MCRLRNVGHFVQGGDELSFVDLPFIYMFPDAQLYIRYLNQNKDTVLEV